MSWRALTIADLYRAISEVELDAIRGAGVSAAGSDPVADAIAATMAKVRGYIGGFSGNSLAAVGIPDALVSTAADIIAYELPDSVRMSPGEDRRRKWEDAMKLLRDVAAGSFAIEQPPDPIAQTVASPTPRITGKTLSFDRDSQNGI